MNNVLLCSYFALWMFVIVLFLTVAVLARQIGLLHARLSPVGARMMRIGPEIGQLIARHSVADIEGRMLELGGEQEKSTMILFLSPTCDSCAELAPLLRHLWKNERRHTNFAVIALAGDQQLNREFILEHRLGGVSYAISPELGREFTILHPPYAVVLDPSGLVKAKGVVNTVEHLESLLNSDELNEPSIESYMHKRSADSTVLTAAPDSSL
jgi:methylamine dehydrogenase accessory protein MauD